MSKIKVNSIEAATGSTITIPSGQTLDISATTLTLPSTVVTTTGTQTLTNKTIGVSQLSGTLPVANGGTGLTTLGSATQVLRVNSGATALEFATVSTGANAGEVIQVITATDSTIRTVTGTTGFVTASNTLSVTITPSSASNKIFVIVTTSAYTYEDATFTIFRGATNLGGNNSDGLMYFGTGATYTSTMSLVMSILDSPNTTSATTYQVQAKKAAGAGQFGFNSETKGVITCFEIKG